MPASTLAARKQPRRPHGCEGHLTRRQAAAVLGFASEFKIREYERQGLLRSVRGPMRTAFYPRAEVLALKARLAERESAPDDEHAWSDADLIALLARPNPAGRERSALDLVTDARISIERAERVYAFWAAQKPMPLPVPTVVAPPPATAPAEPDERRSRNRLDHDRLIAALRDPDPRVRQQAFDRLRAARATPGQAPTTASDRNDVA